MTSSKWGRLLTSRKFWAASLTTIFVGYLAFTKQISTDDAARMIAGSWAVYIGSTAVEDHGIATAAGQALAPAPTATATVNTTPTVAPPPVPGG